MTLDINNKLSLLKNSLVCLSKSYEEQVATFPDYVDVFDEVISDFDNAFRLLPSLMEARIVSYEAVIDILKCNNLIELNLSIEEMQTDESFESDDAWNLVREYATNALNLL
ncbi:hypothetical protein GVN16_10480 [Emticicia sp. CRIBPO]|uniref:hypothetical protein n=1 Tax=Emticicia sp. CRIBPO TaxID=2683258 RepID=UPI00141355FB|nr:hypothetical protein [Emticicia sp. CRIBPO]NBA86189.1 hypothetical protein [Emticicia sp. CRIBPO]